jgi:predicted site-specific integrase-resolvase
MPQKPQKKGDGKMAKQITKIPPRLNPATFVPIESITKRRVAGYARVSTDSEEQKTSYAAQVDYYTKYIKSRADWEFVGVYTDA